MSYRAAVSLRSQSAILHPPILQMHPPPYNLISAPHLFAERFSVFTWMNPFWSTHLCFPFLCVPQFWFPNVASADPPSHLIPPSHFFVQNLCADVRINSSWILLPSLRRQSPIPYPSPDIAVMPPLILLTFLSLCNPSSSFASVNWFLSNLPPIPIAGNL